MTLRTLRNLAAAAFTTALTFLAGCVGTSQPVQPEPEPPVTHIRVLPVMPIDRLHTDNKGIPIGVLWQTIADRIKSNTFTERMESTRLALGSKFTEALVEALKAEGFQASVMEGVAGRSSRPQDIDFARLPGAEPVLHVHMFELGMYSSRFSLDYVPRVNVSASLIRPRSADYIYEESIYYGADSRGNASWSVPPDPRFKWRSFEALVSKPETVAQSYEVAVVALARQIAANIRAETGAPTATE